MNLGKFIFGHRDPEATIRQAEERVAARWAEIEDPNVTMEEWDRINNVHGWNHRALGEPIKIRRRHWWQR